MGNENGAHIIWRKRAIIATWVKGELSQRMTNKNSAPQQVDTLHAVRVVKVKWTRRNLEFGRRKLWKWNDCKGNAEELQLRRPHAARTQQARYEDLKGNDSELQQIAANCSKFKVTVIHCEIPHTLPTCLRLYIKEFQRNFRFVCRIDCAHVSALSRRECVYLLIANGQRRTDGFIWCFNERPMWYSF